MRHIIPISGKDSLAAAIVQTTHEPSLDYEFIYNDTNLELPETYEWLEKVERALGIKIQRIGKSLEALIYEQGILPGPKTRYCTRMAKIIPMEEWIGKEPAIIYLGIRADEERVGFIESENIKARYPLKNLNIGLDQVYQICESKKLRPPTFFWLKLHAEVNKQLGYHAGMISKLPWMLADRLFAWRSRPNCFMCFYQRRYEWLGLLEHHPKLFEKAEELESNCGSGDRREDGFYFIGQDFPLKVIRERAGELFLKRAAQVTKFITSKTQRDFWSDELFDDMDLAQKSCGLFCGK